MVAMAVGDANCTRANAQALQGRQRERRRLAGAGLGAPHEVVPSEHRTDGFQLDGRGRLVALRANGAEERIGETQSFKRSFRTQRTLSFESKQDVLPMRTPSGNTIPRLRSMREARPLNHSTGTKRSKKISRGREQDTGASKIAPMAAAIEFE